MKWNTRIVHWFLGIAAAGFLSLQVLAWHHARALLRYSEEGGESASIESLSILDKARIFVAGASRPRPDNFWNPEKFGLAAETVRFRSSDGVELEAWFVDAPGAGQPVLFFHGFGTSRSSVLDEAAAVQAMGHPVLLVDLRGSGGSDGRRTTMGWHEALDVQAAVAWIKEKLPDREGPFLYGQSMGAAAALRAVSALGVEVDGIVVEAVFDSMLNAVRNRFRAMGWPAFPAAESLVFWGGIQNGFNGFRHNPADYAAGVRIPVLVLHGEQDPRVTTPQARRVYDRLAGPRHFVAFPAAWHSSCLASDPDKWREALGRFLAEAGGP